MGSLLVFALLAAVTLTSTSVVKTPPNDDGTFELLILHNNDMHARFEQTSQLSGACTAEDRDAGKCYGGFPRVAHVVKEARAAAASGEGPPVLYLNAGDTYTGTAWFTIYKWKIAAEFLNALQPDAVSLGNNEFEAESNNLSSFLENLEPTILASNIIVNLAEGKEKIKKSVIIDINGNKVGIVGYLSLEDKLLDTVRSIEYLDEVIAVKEEVEILKSQGINVIIALGHSDESTDIKIAREIDGIDLVIAGHRNTFLWDGRSTDTETFLDSYEPIVVTQSSGKEVPVVQSYAYTKYLGKLSVGFDAKGEITSFEANPVLLDQTVPQDPEAVEILGKYESEIATRNDEVIGTTAVVLDGSSCDRKECNFGNLVTDAMMYIYAINFEGESWTDAPIAIINAGSISATISPPNRPASVTRGDLLEALPSESRIVAVTINGTILLSMLEHAAANYGTSGENDQFLQYSGIRVVFDMAQDAGSRVVSAVVRCWSCFVPEFYVIDGCRDYKILMPAFLSEGGNGYSMLEGSPREELVADEVTYVSEYINKRSPVYPEVAGRITILNQGEPVEDMTDSATALSATVSLGNHEFDNGVSGLTPFIENLTSPTLAANLILNKEPTLQAETKLIPSVVFNISGTQIGVIGYLTPDTKVLAIGNNVEYIEETIALQEEVNRLRNQNVNILIALGHSGFAKDLEIAEKVKGIDLVIGGHTNTFLWNGAIPDSEPVEGPYPFIVNQTSGRSVPVVQAYAYTKYLGKLHLVFDSEGEIVSYDGNPIILDESIPQDLDVLEIINRYKDEVMKISDAVVGNTSVILDAISCRYKECNLGNMITDALVYKYASEYRGEGWTDAPMAVIQRGGIRASIAHINLPANITKGDLINVLPFDKKTMKVTINGSDIMKMLEYAVHRYNPRRAPGEFLHVSGIKVTYDFRKPPGMRVTKVTVKCGMCNIPEFQPLNKTKQYMILMSSFLSMGGDGYAIFKSLPQTQLDYSYLDVVTEYVSIHSPVFPAVEDRITILNLNQLASASNALRSSLVGSVLLLFLFLVASC